MEHFDNPEKFAKDFRALAAKVADHEKLIEENKAKCVKLEARVQALEGGDAKESE